MTIRLAEELTKAFVAKGMMSLPNDWQAMLDREAVLAGSDTYTHEERKADMGWIAENLDAMLHA